MQRLLLAQQCLCACGRVLWTVEGEFIQVKAMGNVAAGRRRDAFFKKSLTVLLFTSENK